uniref:CC domain-containing protein n=1 Tax=Steinernema glaseri TaxID=37863 RepID=A0A1I7ZYQ0_9BILA
MPAPQPVNVVHNVVVNSQKDDCCKSEGASCGGNCPAAGGFGLCGASACAFSFGHIWGSAQQGPDVSLKRFLGLSGPRGCVTRRSSVDAINYGRGQSN